MSEQHELTPQEEKEKAKQFQQVIGKTPPVEQVLEAVSGSKDPEEVIRVGLEKMNFDIKKLKRTGSLHKVRFLDWYTVLELAHYLECWAYRELGTTIKFSRRFLDSLMLRKEGQHIRKGMKFRTLSRALRFNTNVMLKKAGRVVDQTEAKRRERSSKHTSKKK